MTYDEYENHGRALYGAFARLVRTVLKEAFSSGEKVPRPQSLQHRAKAPDSLKVKLETRELLGSAKIECEIKDLAGVRVILYSNTDVDRLLNSRLIPRTFKVEWNETKIHYPTDENDQQRYQAFHYTVSLSDDMAAKPEYAKFSCLRCEIQIQTILNHAWAETYHDMVYKAQRTPGFGSQQLEAFDKRMKWVMDEHLKPAGYALQKVQHDYERLMEGKTLFDRGSLETLEAAADNNVRHAVLTTLDNHVIPNYDDIESVYPDIRRALERTIAVSRNAPVTPIETAFGTIPGQTARDVAKTAIGILTTLRYVDVKGTLDTLIVIYRAETDHGTRKQIVEVVTRLSEYNLDVWKQAGPYVQRLLAETMDGMSAAELAQFRPIALTIWREFLASDIEGSTASANAITLHMGAIPVDVTIRDIREKAIAGLTGLLDTAAKEDEQREAIFALRNATRLPSQPAYSKELCALAIENAIQIVQILTKRINRFSYELLQHVEHELLYDNYRARDIAAVNKMDCGEPAEQLMGAIAGFRDKLNADETFVRYKMLVGFEAVVPPQWEHQEFDFTEVEAYRKERIREFIDAMAEGTTDQWLPLITRCAATKSDDLATFSLFGQFLRDLAKAKPEVALTLLRQADDNVMNFLPAFLTGLWESGAKEAYDALVQAYLDGGEHFAAIVRRRRAIDASAPAIIVAVLHKAVAVKDFLGVFECLYFAVERHDPDTLPLLEPLFVPAMEYLIRTKETRWVREIWFAPQAKSFFPALSSQHAKLVLDNLLAVERIDHHERFLSLLAEHNAALVWDFFESRVEWKDENSRYEAVPYELHALRAPLAKDSDLAVSSVRRWSQSGEGMFRYPGGRLLHSVFPTFTEAFSNSLSAVAAAGGDEDIAFTMRILDNYRGETETHAVIKQIIALLPEGDTRLSGIYVCLGNTGVVWGEYGMVEAHRNRKAAMTAWLEDANPKIKKFAEAYIRELEMRIASEQRRADQSRELRQLDYDADND